MKPDLTPHQAAILAYVREFQLVYLYTPSIKDITNAFGNTKNAVAKTLNQLGKKGHIAKGPSGQVLFPKEWFI